MATKDMDKLVNHAKSTGFVYQGSEIYDGLANTWDFGPLGVEMKNNIKRLWWKRFIQESPYNVGLDSAIFMNPKVWEASGHVGGFSDPLIDCKECKTRHRADKLIEAYDPSVHSEGWSNEQTMSYIKEHNIEQLSAKLLFDLTRNTGFEVSKGVLGECWKKSCCEWKERQEDDFCGLDHNRLSVFDKMKRIYVGSALKLQFPKVGLEVVA